jgi:hypothetical protein
VWAGECGWVSVDGWVEVDGTAHVRVYVHMWVGGWVGTWACVLCACVCVCMGVQRAQTHASLGPERLRVWMGLRVVVCALMRVRAWVVVCVHARVCGAGGGGRRVGGGVCVRVCVCGWVEGVSGCGCRCGVDGGCGRVSGWGSKAPFMSGQQPTSCPVAQELCPAAPWS